MGIKKTDWTDAEEAELKGLYPDNSNQFIALKLNRTEGSVQYKASSLGLRKSPQYLSSLRKSVCTG
jgi:hypothetical protein